MNERVLLIDDDPGVSEVIGLLLEREGYRVERAGSVKASIERIQAGEFELVVTDLKLPDGAVDYVIKPFNNEDFLRAVSRALKIRVTALSGARPLPVEAYIREVVERFQDSTSEIELARMLGIGRKALWMRRRQWGLKRSRKSVS